MVLKGRSTNQDANDAIMEVMLCKHLNISPMELRRIPFEDLMKYKAVLGAIISTKPVLLGIGMG